MRKETEKDTARERRRDRLIERNRRTLKKYRDSGKDDVLGNNPFLRILEPFQKWTKKEHEGDSNCSWCSWNSPQRPEKDGKLKNGGRFETV